MSDEAVNSTQSDPLRSVADALDAAVQAARGGMDVAQSTASEALPALGGMLSTLTYKACYGLSYGVVFPTMLVVRAIPKENAAVHGFIDGARAAMDLVEEMRPRDAGTGHPTGETGHGGDSSP